MSQTSQTVFVLNIEGLGKLFNWTYGVLLKKSQVQSILGYKFQKMQENSVFKVMLMNYDGILGIF